MSTNRREFIKFVVAGAVAAGCPVDSSLVATPAEVTPAVEGEDNKICHQVRDGKAFTRPPVSARHEVVIVGGGVSGMSAVYFLQKRDLLLLEKEPHFGGNAYLLDYQGSAYATGAAFTNQSEVAYKFAKEIGLEPLPIHNWDGTIVKGAFVSDTWGDGLGKLPYPASVVESFKKFRKDMLAIDVEKRSKELYSLPFSNFLKGYADEVKQWWDTYGPSNWGAASEDTAAMVAIRELQEIAGENRKDERYTWVGGLGAITKKLGETLQARFAERMQAGATTVAVVSDKTEVQVTYMQAGELKTVAAKAVIMATPKFITRRIVDGLPQQQSDAMQAMRYIPYPVVNLIFDKPVFSQGYDTWCPGNAFTDFIVADWVVRNQPGYKQKYNILTCYTPMHEEDRGQLLFEGGARKIAAKVLADFQKLMPAFAVDPVEVHIYRRGHPLFVSAPGVYTELQPLARQPMDRVFFANTDADSSVSDTGAAISNARRAVEQVEHRLAGRPVPAYDEATVMAP